MVIPMPPNTPGHHQQGTSGGHHHPRETGAHGHITIVNQHAVQAYELTKFLKQHFKVPTAQPYKAEKLIRRTSRTCVGEYSKEKWRENFSRRQEHLKEGFFTSQCEPYEPLGDIELDSRNMVLNVLAKCLPKKLALPGLGFGGHQVTVSPTKGLEGEGKQKAQSPAGDKLGELSEVDQATAGFTLIQNYLKDTREMLTAGRGGQSFEKCVKEIEERKRQLAESADTSTNAITFLPPKMSAWSIKDVSGPLAASHYQQQHVRSTSAMSTDSMRSAASSASKTKPVDSDVELERMRLAFNRNRRTIIQKLDAIYKIMNALHNMKSRDLRTRVPLSHETVKLLYREVPLFERTGFSRPLGTTTARPCPQGASGPVETIQSADTSTGCNELNPPAGGTRYSNIGRHHSKMLSRSTLPRSSAHISKTLDVPHSTTPPMAWKKYGRVGMVVNKLKTQQKEQQEKDSKQIETWEDLLALQTGSSSLGAGQHRLSVNPEKTAGYGMKWLHLQQRQHEQHQPTPSKQPYWLTVSLSGTDKAKRPVPVSANGVSKEKTNPEETLQSLKENFAKSQRKLAREIMTDLERMERERCRTFRQKFHTCSGSPLFERTVKHMREVAPIIQVGAMDDADIEIKPSKWYTDLRGEAESLVGKDDQEVFEILQKLSRFYHEDSRSIPNAKEKLCLLLMSMPASQLLTIPMQQAIQFVMENIILAPPECFSQWLQQRKVPQIIPSSQV